MADYSKRTNAELSDLLKSRSLPHTGKKAELVARLQEHDASTAATAKPGADEIDWEEENGASSATGAAALAAGGTGPVSNPTAVPNQIPAENPSTTNDLTVSEPAATTTTTTTDQATESAPAGTTATPAPPPHDYSSHLPSSTVESELAKRKARAARFGTATSTDDALKALERAKKFGGAGGDAGGAVKGIDSALPERVERSRGVKRGRGGGGEEGGGGGGAEAGARHENGGGKRQDSRRREHRGGAGAGTGTGTGTGNSTAGGKAAGTAVSGLSEKDRLAAEARKARFSGQTGGK